MHFELMRPEEPVNLPMRATQFSAGYDFFAPFDFEIAPHSKLKVPTNVTIRLESGSRTDWVLKAYPRSSLGCKKDLMLANTVGIIDADYCGFEIFFALKNDSDEVIKIAAGDRFVQGVFEAYLITSDDEAYGTRVGGFGSTGK